MKANLVFFECPFSVSQILSHMGIKRMSHICKAHVIYSYSYINEIILKCDDCSRHCSSQFWRLEI